MKILLAALSARPCCFAGCVNTSKSNKPLVALQQAPEFTLKNVLGGELKSADLKGKVLVVDFWATWCVPCKMEIPEYNELRINYKDQGVEFRWRNFRVRKLDGEYEGIPQGPQDRISHVRGQRMQSMSAFGGHPGYPTTFLIGKDWKIYRKIFGSPRHQR